MYFLIQDIQISNVHGVSTIIYHMIFENLIICIASPQYTNISKYNYTKQFYVNSYPWLFSSGVGDIYDLEGGTNKRMGATFIAILRQTIS
jgi:hypothetical protein